MNVKWLRVMTVVASGAVAACGGGNPTGVDPDLALVAGLYAAEGPLGAIVLTTREAGSTEDVDWLARGGSLLMDLRVDGTTTGRLYVPGADEDGGDLDEDLTGTWQYADGVVTFDHDADTFIRDTPFAFDGEELTGHYESGSVSVHTVLRRR